MRVLITGACGFIGYHVAKRFLSRGCQVYGYDNLNDYYNPVYKDRRLSDLAQSSNFTFSRGNLENFSQLEQFYQQSRPTHVVHLAAQAGVRYSIDNPMSYISSNIVGFQNLLELVRKAPPENFVFASSSSVYGGSKNLPFSEDQEINNPVSLYAATKAANELFARTYSNMYGINSTGLRFFTVYGPQGRPDMALFLFAKSITEGKPISLFNGGAMTRDFTYIDDIVNGIVSAVGRPKKWAIYNLGRGKPESLLEMLKLLETNLGSRAIVQNLPIQLGDLETTHANIDKAAKELGYNPTVNIDIGISRFVEWFRNFEL